MATIRSRRQKNNLKRNSTNAKANSKLVKRHSQNTTTFRWGESYTSLLLGLIVVIIGILFVVSFARMQHIKQITTITTNILSSTPPSRRPSATPTTLSAEQKALINITNRLKNTPTQQPPQRPTATKYPKPTKIPTQMPTQTIQPSVVVSGTAQSITPVISQQVYTVSAGDDLWSIAEKFYHSGYNYMDIARANKLENPGLLYSGMKLSIPQSITPEPQTITPTPTISAQQPQQITQQNNTIIGTSYIIQKNDDLWDIALRAYGNGYRWTDIAKANNLTEPSKIYSGNTLVIPR